MRHYLSDPSIRRLAAADARESAIEESEQQTRIQFKHRDRQLTKRWLLGLASLLVVALLQHK
jgi:hypothetical protein